MPDIGIYIMCRPEAFLHVVPVCLKLASTCNETVDETGV